MKEYIEIEIGNSVFMYKHTENYTKILDTEGEIIMELRWIATEREVKAAVYGYLDGEKIGRILGRVGLQYDIKKLLEIS